MNTVHVNHCTPTACCYGHGDQCSMYGQTALYRQLQLMKPKKQQPKPKKQNKPAKAKLEKLILKASHATGDRIRLIGSYSGPSPDNGREEAVLGARLETLVAVLDAMDGDCKFLEKMGEGK